eukprot:scaffold8777_cov48-Phaeocystis_antarctica.AAC.1
MPLCCSHRLASKVKGAIKDPAGFLEKELKLRAVDTLEISPGVRGLLAPAARRRIRCDEEERPVRQGAQGSTHTRNPRLGTLISYDVGQVMPVAKATLYTIKAVNGLRLVRT